MAFPRPYVPNARAHAQPFKYAPTVRATTAAGPPGQPVHSSVLEPLSSAILAAAHPNDQKQMLGERVFPLIQVRPLNFHHYSLFFSFTAGKLILISGSVHIGETSRTCWKGHWNVARNGKCRDSGVDGRPWPSYFSRRWGSGCALHASEDTPKLNHIRLQSSKTEGKPYIMFILSLLFQIGKNFSYSPFLECIRLVPKLL